MAASNVARRSVPNTPATRLARCALLLVLLTGATAASAANTTTTAAGRNSTSPAPRRNVADDVPFVSVPAYGVVAGLCVCVFAVVAALVVFRLRKLDPVAFGRAIANGSVFYAAKMCADIVDIAVDVTACAVIVSDDAVSYSVQALFGTLTAVAVVASVVEVALTAHSLREVLAAHLDIDRAAALNRRLDHAEVVTMCVEDAPMLVITVFVAATSEGGVDTIVLVAALLSAFMLGLKCQKLASVLYHLYAQRSYEHDAAEAAAIDAEDAEVLVQALDDFLDFEAGRSGLSDAEVDAILAQHEAAASASASANNSPKTALTISGNDGSSPALALLDAIHLDYARSWYTRASHDVVRRASAALSDFRAHPLDMDAPQTHVDVFAVVLELVYPHRFQHLQRAAEATAQSLTRGHVSQNEFYAVVLPYLMLLYDKDFRARAAAAHARQIEVRGRPAAATEASPRRGARGEPSSPAGRRVPPGVISGDAGTLETNPTASTADFGIQIQDVVSLSDGESSDTDSFTDDHGHASFTAVEPTSPLAQSSASAAPAPAKVRRKSYEFSACDMLRQRRATVAAFNRGHVVAASTAAGAGNDALPFQQPSGSFEPGSPSLLRQTGAIAASGDFSAVAARRRSVRFQMPHAAFSNAAPPAGSVSPGNPALRIAPQPTASASASPRAAAIHIESGPPPVEPQSPAHLRRRVSKRLSKCLDRAVRATLRRQQMDVLELMAEEPLVSSTPDGAARRGLQKHTSSLGSSRRSQPGQQTPSNGSNSGIQVSSVSSSPAAGLRSMPSSSLLSNHGAPVHLSSQHSMRHQIAAGLVMRRQSLAPQLFPHATASLAPTPVNATRGSSSGGGGMDDVPTQQVGRSPPAGVPWRTTSTLSAAPRSPGVIPLPKPELNSEEQQRKRISVVTAVSEGSSGEDSPTGHDGTAVFEGSTSKVVHAAADRLHDVDSDASSSGEQ